MSDGGPVLSRCPPDPPTSPIGTQWSQNGLGQAAECLPTGGRVPVTRIRGCQERRLSQGALTGGWRSGRPRRPPAGCGARGGPAFCAEW